MKKEFDSNLLDALIKSLCARTNTEESQSGFREMHTEIESWITERKKKSRSITTIGENYIYKQIWLPLQKKTNEAVRVNPRVLDVLAQFLGFENFPAFEQQQSFPPGFEEYCGNWYSCVRCNSGEPYVLFAPVRIEAVSQQAIMELRGPSRSFRGQVILKGDVLSATLQSDEKKILHLVLKTGLVKKPFVFQGVFSGISSGGDPIAGREVLVRTNKEFDKLKNQRLKISALLESKERAYQAIGRYFEKVQGNILKAGVSSTFRLDDLESNSTAQKKQ